ncbi:centrosomal protein of 83 kDa-like [Haliotis cracherodii]|uniref:centrosomal protein of 83 kDa-like n=1 Tax=Haliotis cracherodii TaxID=6455 RepID=UPI0039E823F7
MQNDLRYGCRTTNGADIALLKHTEYRYRTGAGRKMATASFLAGSPLQGGGSSLAQQLPQLMQETELQKMLTDERMRSEQHKTNYQQLKTEHSRLQDEYMQLQMEVKSTIEESRIVQEKYKTMLEQTRRELVERTAEIEELRAKVVTPQRLEILKLQVTEDLEKTYREKYYKQEQEIEEYRNSLNKVRYEFSFLKSEYEHDKLESQRVVEELKMQHDAEVTNLRKERDTTINRITTENTADSQKVRVLQRENAQLHLKLKSLLSEMEEIRAQREKIGLESDSVTRIQSKQLSENTAVIKSLEAERESLHRQSDSLQRELSGTGETHNRLTGKIHELEKENLVFKNRVEELTHKNKVELTNLKMEMLKQRGDLERERDRLANMVEDMQTNIEISEHKIEQQSLALEEKEREAVRRVQAAREEEFTKFTQAENEKLELEAKLQEVDRKKIDEEAARHVAQERMGERIAAANSARDSAEKELLVLKTRIHNFESLQSQLERERGENSDLKSKISKLEDELGGFLGNEHDMTDQVIKLRNQNELLKDELRLTKDQMVKIQDNHDRIVAQQRAALVDEKTQLGLRVQDLEEKYSNAHSKLQKAASIHKKYKKKHHRVTEHLREKLQVLDAKNTELDLEKQALSRCVPQDAYNRLKKQWKDLYRRHQEFRAMLLPGVRHVNIGDKSFATINMPFDASLPNWSVLDLEQEHQDDLRLLKQRLDTLDDTQRQQLQELTEITNKAFRQSQFDGHATLTKADLDSRSTLRDNAEDSREKADEEKASM